MHHQKSKTEVSTDARWVSCGGSYCTGLDAPSLELLQSIELDMVAGNQSVFAADHQFLERIVSGITGLIPGFTVKVLERPKEPVEFYEFHVMQPAPDSDDPTKDFLVARKGYSLGAVKRDVNLVLANVYAVAEALALHEVKEGLRYNGVRIHSPHDGVESILP
jgi:hypothetical protein